jgi:serine/threonine protein kinase/tetratricopeptide (TPR) repeat protein
VARSETAVLLSLAESIADGAAIDWAAAEAHASPDDQAIVRQLRILADLAVLHRSLPPGSEPAPSLAPVREGLDVPATGSWAHLSLIERLGGGTFGEVYRAWDRHLERDVALKLLRAGKSIDDLDASRITHEGRLLARIRHANVITVYGVDSHDGRVGLWMELVRGVTLEQQLTAHGPLSSHEATLVGLDLCRALAAIHAAGLIHRDVKAQNVMREDGGRIVLMDLGTGRKAGVAGDTAAPDLAGTPLYLAPEIFSGVAASERTDLYSLGVLLYHLVTAAFPVRATTIRELHDGHKQRRAIRLRDARADLPTAFVRVVERAIAPDPECRYSTAGAFEADLAQALNDFTASEAMRTGTVRQLETLPDQKMPARRFLPQSGVLAVTVAVLVTIAVVGWSWLHRQPISKGVAPGTVRSIAVLPLANMSGDPAQEYFADGMTDQLIATLGQVGGINVISRTSSMRFKGSRQPLPEIARALRVDAVVEGSVWAPTAAGSTDAKRVRINARLIYAGTDTQLWDRTFEGVVADVLVLQRDVAQAVVDGINLQLASPQSPARGSGVARGLGGSALRPVQPQAFEAYLRGRYLWNKRTPEDLRNALAAFKQAVDLDPTSALAWSGLADGYSILANYDDQPPRLVKPQAKAAALRALQLDDSLAEAHAALAELAWNYDWDFAAASREFDRALALNPNYANALHWRGLHLNWIGRFDEALADIQRAEELDPLSPIIKVSVARTHFYARRYDRAAAILEQLSQHEPGFWPVHAVLGQVYLAQDRHADAIRELVTARNLSPSSMRNLGVLGDVYARAGKRSEARAILAELERLARVRYVPPVYEAMVHMGLGDTRRALDRLDQAFLDRSDWILQLPVEPQFDLLRGEKRFQDLLRRAGQHSRP